MKKQKLGSSETEPALMDAFKAMGYQMIPVNMNQIVMSLTGGMVDAVYQSPVYAGSLQLFGLAKNMADINVAPLMGGIVMNQAAWRAIPDKYKPELIKITKKFEAGLDISIQALVVEIIQTMKQFGLIIHQLTPAQKQLWYDDGKRIIPALLGKTLDREMYGRIETILTTHRAGQ
jgi:TRAP-type C4-dicarboxylate transport system substrate-binding protein